MLYIAHPIDFDNSGRGWTTKTARGRSAIKDLLSEAGINSYWPSDAFRLADLDVPLTEQETSTIYDTNQAALRGCDGLLALLPEGSRTLGVPLEIEYALGHGKQVAIWTYPGAMQTVQMSAWARAGAHVTTNSIDAVYRLKNEIESKTKIEERTVDDYNESSLKVRMAEPNLAAPKRSYPGDAGFDLTCSADTFIGVGQVVDIPCGFDIELPEGWWGLIVPRSSTWANHGVLVQQAVIDQGYRGPMYVVAFNPSTRNLVEGVDGRRTEYEGQQTSGIATTTGALVKAGDRVAQLVPLPLFPGDVLEVQALSNSERGNRGFGSSGR